jgi:AAA family ATP:ADP antiporter
LLQLIGRIGTEERRAVLLAFCGNFLLFGSYYILRPVRDTVATIGGIGQLQLLFTATFIGTLLAAPLYAALASRLRLSRLLPALFWFWLANVVLFALLYRVAPGSKLLAAAYYVWFSVVNLYMLSVFWSLMVDLFSAAQSVRVFPLIAAGGELGAIAGPLLTRLLVGRIGLSGLLWVAAAEFAAVIALVYLLMREKRRLHALGGEGQASSLERGLGGNPLQGFGELFSNSYARAQAFYVLLMTWANTVAYYFQTDLVAHAYPQLAGRAQAIADIDLAVNIGSALVLFFGLGSLLRRFGLTTALLLNPVVMAGSLLALIVSPSLLMIQVVQVVRRVAQYAVTTPSRQICFTVMPQVSRYKTKNVIDTVFYRFGDLSSAWVQSGLVGAGFGLGAGAALGIGASALWGGVGAFVGRRYEKLRREQDAEVS